MPLDGTIGSSPRKRPDKEKALTVVNCDPLGRRSPVVRELPRAPPVGHAFSIQACSNSPFGPREVTITSRNLLL